MAVTRLLLASCLTAALSLGGLAQTIVADPRVEKAFKELNWSYKADEDADFQVIMQTEENRTQLLVVRSRTFSNGKLELREIWSAASLIEGEVPAETARLLLDSNLQVKLGFWSSLPQSEGKKQLVMYVARIPVSVDTETFAEYCQGVADVADAMEAELTGKDQY